MVAQVAAGAHVAALSLTEFAGRARLSAYRFEVTAAGGLQVATLQQENETAWPD